MPRQLRLIVAATLLLAATSASAVAKSGKERIFVAQTQAFGAVASATIAAVNRALVTEARRTPFRVVMESQLGPQRLRYQGLFRRCERVTGQCSIWAARLARAKLVVRSEVVRLSASLYQLRFALTDPTWQRDVLRTDFAVFGNEQQLVEKARLGIMQLFRGKTGTELLERYRQSYGLYGRIRVGDLKLAYGLWRALLGEEGIERIAPEQRVLDLKDPYRSFGRVLVRLRVPGWLEVDGRRFSDFSHPIVLDAGTHRVKVHAFTGELRRVIKLRVAPRRTRMLSL